MINEIMLEIQCNQLNMLQNLENRQQYTCSHEDCLSEAGCLKFCKVQDKKSPYFNRKTEEL